MQGISWKNCVTWAALGLGGVYVILFGALGFLVGPWDHNHLAGYYDLAWRFWQMHGAWTLPQYNPFLCGGRSLGGDPQIPIFHPLLWGVPLFGAPLAMKLEMLLQLALGTLGIAQILQRFGASREERIFGCFVFSAGGAVVAKYMVGHVTMGFYILLPLFISLSYRLSEKSEAKTELAYYALFIYSGLYKPNFFIYGLPLLGIEHAVRAVYLRRPRILLYALAGTILAAGTGAVSLLPSWKYFSDFPRAEMQSISVPVYAFFANLLLPLKAIPEAWYGPHFLQRHEYNLFLGPVLLYLTGRGFRTARRVAPAEAVALSALLVTGVLLGLGSAHAEIQALSPYTWIRAIWPGFSSIRVPTRFWFGAYLTLVLFAALGLPKELSRKQIYVFWIGGILPLFLTALVNLGKVPVLSSGPQWRPTKQIHWGFGWHHADVNDSYRFLREGKGVLECIENMQIHEAPDLKEAPLLSVLPRSFRRLNATWLAWDRFEIEGELNNTTQRIHLNVNHSPYWRFEGGGAFISSGLGEPLTLTVPDGHFSGELRFRNPYVREALMLSLSSWILFIFYVAFRTRVLTRR